MLRRRLPAHPAGFTLIELLVVIAIIGILIGLLLPAVQKVRIIGKRTQAANDISQLNNAATNFKNDWGQYPPTTFTIPTVKNSNDQNFQLLAAKYPRWAANIAEGGNTNLLLPAGGAQLVGNQCLVYFLGGPPTTAGGVGLVGWAHDQPAAPTGNAKTLYLDISANRLQAGNAVGYANASPVFIDPFGMPYAYFGSNKIGGKYATTAVGGTSPVFESTNKGINENGCQIICAGENKAFGPGGVWTPGAGSYSSGQAGADDMANFNNGLMLSAKP